MRNRDTLKFGHLGNIGSAGRIGLAAALMAVCAATSAAAQDNPLAPGWDLALDQSNLTFQSIKTTKDGLKVESSSFATFSGEIAADGTATVSVLLDSVDTTIDLRNVRMRFLFFETFKFPEATITLAVTPDMIADLPKVRRKTLELPYTLSLHGLSMEKTAQVAVTLLDDDTVSVASAVPIPIEASDFGLSENISKLEDAAGNITIVPSATVTFDFAFARRGDDGEPAAAPAPVAAASAALEPEGEFSRDACVGRFEILSRTGNIYFRTASARLQPASDALLTSVVDIVQRCPSLNIVIAGHTDADGGALANQRLSESRAASVMTYLTGHGVAPERLRAVGYGEDRPIAANDTAANKALNRRIEFAVDDN